MTWRIVLGPVGFVLGPLVALGYYVLMRARNGGRRLKAETGRVPGTTLSVVYMLVPKSLGLPSQHFTLGQKIYMEGEQISPAALLHELRHVYQWDVYGPVLFPALYGWEQAVHGRKGNRFELIARLHAPGTY